MKLRPWSSGEAEGKKLSDGDRIDVKWKDGVTSGHDFSSKQGVPGFILSHHDTKIWVPLSEVEFRKILTSGKKYPSRTSYSRKH